MTKPRVGFPAYRELTVSDLQCDLHVHTSRTDGVARVDAILRAAVERRLTRIAFTEHVRRDSDWFPDFVQEVREKARTYPQLEVLVGCETKALDTHGTLDASEEILSACDIILGSVHRFPDGKGGYLAYASLTPEALAQVEFDLAMGLLGSNRVDVLAHPGGMYARQQSADLPTDLLRALVVAAEERGVAIEINTSYLQNVDGLLSLLEDVNPNVSIASDMHRLEDLGRCRDLLEMRLGPTNRGA